MRSTALIALASLSCLVLAAPHQEDQTAAPKRMASISLAMLPGRMTAVKPAAILLKKDGTAVYVVERGKMKGTFRASGLAPEFEKVSKALIDCTYWQMAERFGPAGMSMPILELSVTAEGSTKKLIDAGPPRKREFGRKAPKQLKQIEQMLMNLAQTANWQKVSEKTDLTAAIH